jgi:hypothetical protein
MAADTVHPSFIQPENSSAKIWRYLDLAKFISLLKNRSLHFTRLDQFDDPFEGTITKQKYDELVQVAQVGEREKNIPWHWQGRYFDILMAMYRRAPKCHFINCWHMNEHESEAMWKLYSKSEYAVSIQTEYRRLVSVLPDKLYNGCYIGKVNYVDHYADDIPGNNMFNYVMHKSMSLQHEREVRAVVWMGDPGEDKIDIINRYPSSISIPVDIHELITSVTISPLAPKWMLETVIDITAKYGADLLVQESTLTRPPFK